MLATFEYDHFDRRSLLLRGNGRRTIYEYDRASRLSALVNTSFGSAADVRFEFTYNPASQIVTRWSSNDSYAWTSHFNENKTGNANGLNQLTQVDTKSLSHDARGNVTSFGTKSFTYSSENMMKTGPGSTDLHYDPALRLEQVVSGGTTRPAYDGLDRVAEHDGANAIQRRYVHGPGIDEPLVWYEASGTSDRRFLEGDERGSVILVADTAGATLATNRYDEYGQPQATNLGRFGYTGQAWLPTIGEWYYKARIYDSELGRFLQADPIGYAGGLNLYAYVGNDPVNSSDPLGFAEQRGPGCYPTRFFNVTVYVDKNNNGKRDPGEPVESQSSTPIEFLCISNSGGPPLTVRIGSATKGKRSCNWFQREMEKAGDAAADISGWAFDVGLGAELGGRGTAKVGPAKLANFGRLVAGPQVSGRAFQASGYGAALSLLAYGASGQSGTAILNKGIEAAIDRTLGRFSGPGGKWLTDQVTSGAQRSFDENRCAR